jgi:hypothetical protein
MGKLRSNFVNLQYSVNMNIHVRTVLIQYTCIFAKTLYVDSWFILMPLKGHKVIHGSACDKFGQQNSIERGMANWTAKFGQLPLILLSQWTAPKAGWSYPQWSEDFVEWHSHAERSCLLQTFRSSPFSPSFGGFGFEFTTTILCYIFHVIKNLATILYETFPEKEIYRRNYKLYLEHDTVQEKEIHSRQLYLEQEKEIYSRQLYLEHYIQI